MRRCATGLGAVAGLVLLAGCGPQEKAGGSDVAVANSFAKTPPPPPSPNTNAVAVATAKIAKYWTVDRFVYDGAKPPVQLAPMFPFADSPLNPLLAKAPRDVFYGIQESVPVSSDAYVWGLVRAPGADPSAGGDLWFGTVANTLCYAQQSILGYGLPQFPAEYMDGYWKCEFGTIGGPGTDLPDARYGDWRPPHIYRYDTDWKGSVEELNVFSTPGFGALPPLYLMDPRIDGPNPPQMILDAVALQNKTIGFRSAGTSRGVIFIAGPGIDDPFNPLDGSIILFAYRDSEPPEFLGATELTEYNNVRSWVADGDELYVGVGVKGTAGPYGAVLRWTGYLNPSDPYDPDTLFTFEKVGTLETEAANLAIHDRSIYVTTWPYFASPNPADWKAIGLFRSPRIPEGGSLTAAQAGQWTKLWSISSYDPDYVAALSTGGGALESFGGSIYWGTMHVPFAAGLAAFQLSDMYPGVFTGSVPLDEKAVARVVNMMLGGHRSPAVFRGQDVTTRKSGTKFQVTLLYGEKYLPKAVLPPRGDGVYRIDPNTAYATNSMPAYGPSGFGNFFNAYIWSATRYADRLWMGTFDWSQLARVGLQTIANTQPDPNSPQAVLAYRVAQALLPIAGAIVPQEGADLYRFDPPSGDPPTLPPAVAENLTGLGNDTNYGFRTMVTGPIPGSGPKPLELQTPSPVVFENLYIGTANAMNLHPRGGWELLQLPPPYRKPVCVCDDGVACTDDSCDEYGKCFHSSNCAEGLTCNYGTGLCDEAPPSCDPACYDGDPCTDDVCTADGFCSYPSNGSCVQPECTPETVTTDCPAPSDPCQVAVCAGGTCSQTKKCQYPEVCTAGVGTCYVPEPN